MSVRAGFSDSAMAIKEKLRGRIGQTKVKRYWPGKAPVWHDDVDEDGDLIGMSTSRAVGTLGNAFSSDEGLGIVKGDDARLRRLAQSMVDDREEVMADHRWIRQAEIVSTLEEHYEGGDFEEMNEDALEERRRWIKEKLLERQKEEDALLPMEEEEEDESEYETDSDEELTTIVMLKPVFVPKDERDTIAERERLEAEERALEDLVKIMMEERKAETKKLVVEEIRRDEQIHRNMEREAAIADVDTDDELNVEEECEAWKARKAARMMRARGERSTMLKEKEEIERVRNMTEEERREWERKNPKPVPLRKQKWTFMQRYYHKGAFFQSDADDIAATAGSDNIFDRDFSLPTGEDKMNKSILPKVMQVKHFGRSGRTKWTHLINEDTTDLNLNWGIDDLDEKQNNSLERLRTKYYSKMAGMHATIARPKGSKKMKDWESL